MHTLQELLFKKNTTIKASSNNTYRVPDEFYLNGFYKISHFEHHVDVQDFINKFISSIDFKKSHLPLFFQNRIQLAKCDHIPSKECLDASVTEHISLHFDMGLPLVPFDEFSDIYVFTCLYFPYQSEPSSAKTRLFDIHRLASKIETIGKATFEKAIYDYVSQFGDGWEQVNTGRIACLGRLIEALFNKNDLYFMRNHRIAEWFNFDGNKPSQSGSDAEAGFFNKYSIDLQKFAKQILMAPGDLLIIDNTRVAHGRAGQRKPEELVQFLFGIEGLTKSEVHAFRMHLSKQLT